MEKVGLSRLTGGALQEKFDRAMESVINNMQDPNTPWKNKRGITIKLVFEQNEDRNDATVNISVETKTAPVKPIATRMAVGKDLETGDVFAQEYGDNGVMQKATIKTGVSTVGDAIVPNPVRLRPFRTFVEVEQPESAFVFRMRQKDGRGVECAIFDADGGAWKNIAMENIKRYLEFELEGISRYTVIS